MDGLDLSAIDQLDQDLFNGSLTGSDDDDGDMPLPDCIGIDSALQDDEQLRLSKDQLKVKKEKARSELERELELEVLRPGSIRRQIFEQSLKASSRVSSLSSSSIQGQQAKGSSKPGPQVMNIVEKAGMKEIDKEKINEIIHNASKGSLFYKKQAQRQEEILKSIEKMLNKIKNATPAQVERARITSDKILQELESQRVFNRIIVHFDLDMFFAAVEIRDNPELADKPIAVGGDSMVSTSNYIARKYGVRAAMPGFIARKLCPELLLIKPNGFKYRQASSEVFSVLEMYDPELTSMSLDEAYLDLTEYVKSSLDRDGIDSEEFYDGTLPEVWWKRANEVVQEIRDAIHDKTKLTCSAGIACNTLLAKISTDINKPNGQFMVQGYPREVLEFIRKTPVVKVSGIGKVSSQFLNALEINTCGDIYEKRHYLPIVFYEINVRFYLRVSLGDGSTCIQSDEQRKSKSVERTFTPIKDTLMMLDKLDDICEELCTKYLRPYRIRGRTVTIKLKRNTFSTTTKSYSILAATNDKAVIYATAKNLLLSEMANEDPAISYRLLGVKLSNLADDSVATNQLTIDAMLRNQELKPEKSSVAPALEAKVDESDSGEKLDGLEHQDAITTDNDFVPLDQHQPSSDSSNDFGQTCSPDTQLRDASSHPSDSSAFINVSSSPPRKKRNTNEAKMSLYQRFIESNSQRLSQSPKVEPFQCPYCIHGFLSFESLERHVIMCTKRDK